MKRLFLDSANIDEIRRAVRSGAVSGVTTNPSLMAKEPKGLYFGMMTKIADVIGEESHLFTMHLSVEAIALCADEMVEQALQLRDIMNDKEIELFVKVPVTFDNLEVISRLAEERINVNATACMKASQAKMASDAGADVVSFFYNRMIDGCEDKVYARVEAMGEIALYRKLCPASMDDDSDIHAEVICGSIRKANDVLECWNAGADIVTVSMKVMDEMIKHPQTDIAIKRFQEDFEKWRS
jgi:transaldolase